MDSTDNSAIKALYESFGIEEKDQSSDRTSRYRLNTIHIRGVNEMSTGDILDYFDPNRCTSVEWINDYSCNGVWPDANSAAQAMLGVSKPTISNESVDVEMEEVDVDRGVDENSVDSLKDDQKSDPVVEKEQTVSTDVKNLGIPIPPGKWRLGVAHEKSKVIVMRFALVSDKKLPGAEKRSQYYLKYGNPNYGGMVGLISKSKKRKYRELKTQDDDSTNSDQQEEERSLLNPQVSENDDSSSDDEETHQVIKKKLKMKMYADKEIEQQKLLKEKQNGDDLRHKLVSNRRSNIKIRQDEPEKESCVDLRQKLTPSENSVDLRSYLEKRSDFSERSSSRSESDLRKKLNNLRKARDWDRQTKLLIAVVPENN